MIKNSLESLGASVDLLYSRPTDFVGKFSEIFLVKKYEKIKQKYFNKIFKKSRATYDFVLIIRADLIPLKFMTQIKNKYSNAGFIQYIWDDIELFPKLKESFSFFDKILSYNLNDCRNYQLIFRPFFFAKSQDTAGRNNSIENRIFFIGSYHSDRLQIIEKVKELNPLIKFDFHLYINPIAFILSRISIRKLPYFKFRKMDYSEMQLELEKSTAILDIQNLSQIGLTTRVFEALGAGKKVITVNENIVNYDIYNIDNILLINRNYPKIEKAWMNTPFKKYEKTVIDNYNVENWIKDVFS